MAALSPGTRNSAARWSGSMDSSTAAAQPDSMSRPATALAHRNTIREFIGISFDARPAQRASSACRNHTFG
jgi:hypothetical protein